MNKLENLIKKLCSNGAEFKSINDLLKSGELKIITPSFKIKRNDYCKDGKIPIISQEAEYISGYSNEIDKKISAGEYICFGDHSEHIKYIDFKFVQGADGLKIIKTNSNKLSMKYLYYAVSSKYNRHNNYERHFKYFAETRVPVPPLEVQCEIVHILDDFTLLSAELSAELKARQKQYNYYTYKLFENCIDNFVELDSIGEVTKLAGFEFSQYVRYTNKGNIIALRGLNVKNGKLILNDVKYIDNSDLSKLNRSKLYENDILYTYVGTVGQVGLVDKNDKYYLAPNVARIRITNENVLPKYVMYFLLTDEFKRKQLDILSGTSSMKNITMTNIRKFKIPVPSIKEQNKIVNILDRFAKLCNDISDGLPAEIEARQKQYEYYRDKLLTFKELVNEG